MINKSENTLNKYNPMSSYSSFQDIETEIQLAGEKHPADVWADTMCWSKISRHDCAKDLPLMYSNVDEFTNSNGIMGLAPGHNVNDLVKNLRVNYD